MSASYDYRIERFLANHPGATLAEARGHPIAHPGPDATPTQYLKYENRVSLSQAAAAHKTKMIDDKRFETVKKLIRGIEKLNKQIEKAPLGKKYTPGWEKEIRKMEQLQEDLKKLKHGPRGGKGNKGSGDDGSGSGPSDEGIYDENDDPAGDDYEQDGIFSDWGEPQEGDDF